MKNQHKNSAFSGARAGAFSVVLLVFVAMGMAAPAHAQVDLVPPLASCTATARSIDSFSCGSNWVIGTAPSFTCASPTSCTAPRTVFNCNSGACQCPSGQYCATANTCQTDSGVPTCASQSRQTSCAGSGTALACGACLATHYDCDSGAGYDCRVGTTAAACITPVSLQAASPGTAQTGHVNVTGDLRSAGMTSLGSSSLVLVNGQNALYGVLSGSSTGGNFVLFEQPSGTPVFSIDRTGDVAVNGGDITSTSGNLAVGANGASQGNVYIGSVTASGSPDLLVLGNKNTVGDLASPQNGALYYNSNTSRFRCYEGSQWKDCIGASMPNGTATGDTARWNGSAWQVDNTLSVFADSGVGAEVGIGVADPQSGLQIHGGGGGSSDLLLTHNISGSTLGDGFRINIAADQSVAISQQEAMPMTFYVNGLQTMSMVANGDVGFGGTGSALVVNYANNNVMMGTNVSTQDVRVKSSITGSLVQGATAFEAAITNNNASNAVSNETYAFRGAATRANSVSGATNTVYGLYTTATHTTEGLGSSNTVGVSGSATSGLTSNKGVYGYAVGDSVYYGSAFGGHFVASSPSFANNSYPVYGVYATGNGSNANYGIYATSASGTSASLATNTHAGYFYASNSAVNGTTYGVYADTYSSAGVQPTYALYTARGRVHIQGSSTASTPAYATATGSLYVNNAIETDSYLSVGSYIALGTTGSVTVRGLLLDVFTGGRQLMAIKPNTGTTDDGNFVSMELEGVQEIYTEPGVADTSLDIINYGNGPALVITDQPADTTYFVVDASGNVGIGDYTPDYMLHILNPTSAATLGVTASSAGDADPMLLFGTDAFAVNFSMGMDDSDAEKFKISSGTVLGTTDRLVIETDGDVGIGTSSPAGRLHIANTNANFVFDGSASTSGYRTTFSMTDTGLTIGHNSAARDIRIAPNSASTYAIVAQADADVVVGEMPTTGGTQTYTASDYGAEQLHVIDDTTTTSVMKIENWNSTFSTSADGLTIKIGAINNATAPGTGNDFIIFRKGDNVAVGQIDGNGAGGVNYTTTSDARLKENVIDYDGALALLGKMRVRKYNMIGSSMSEVGFLAQELYSIYPDVVSVGGDAVDSEPWGVDYGRMTPLIIRGLQEMNARMTILEDGTLSESNERVTELESRVDRLERELLELQMRMNQRD